jgi:hypothetical protein
MKTIFKNIVLLSFLSLLLIPNFALADELSGPLECCELKSDVNYGSGYSKGDVIASPSAPECVLGGTTRTIDYVTQEWGLICLMGSVGLITQWVFIGLMVVSPLMIMLGTYYIVTAGMDPERVGKGKKFIIWAAVGIVIGLFSNAIPNLVTSLLA